MITVNDILPHFESKADIARAMGVSRQVVNGWGNDKPIPAVHELRLRYEVAPRLGLAIVFHANSGEERAA